MDEDKTDVLRLTTPFLRFFSVHALLSIIKEDFFLITSQWLTPSSWLIFALASNTSNNYFTSS